MAPGWEVAFCQTQGSVRNTGNQRFAGIKVAESPDRIARRWRGQSISLGPTGKQCIPDENVVSLLAGRSSSAFVSAVAFRKRPALTLKGLEVHAVAQPYPGQGGVPWQNAPAAVGDAFAPALEAEIRRM